MIAYQSPSRLRGRAYWAVNQAIQRGELKPARECICVDCGATATEYDHRDYNEPLNVSPVCHRCNLRRGPAIEVFREAA